MIKDRTLRALRSNLFQGIALIFMTGFACLEVSRAARVLSTTVDEPFHIAAGMEWLDKGTYTYELLHPPLARALMATGPYLRGLRSPGGPRFGVTRGWLKEGNVILSSRGDYLSNLAWARAGNLPFFVIASFTVFVWARRWFGRASALWAVLLFVSLPPILGHAGLAMLDVASAATVTLGLYAFMRCVEKPSWPSQVLLGAAMALALLCKFSGLPFLGACFLVTAAWLICTKRLRLPQPGRLLLRCLVVASVAFLLVWAGYRFATAPISPSAIHPRIDRVFASTPLLRTAAYRAVKVRVPLGEFVKGIRNLMYMNEFQPWGFLFGRAKRGGWWYFFPIAVLLKTPIGFLVLVILGLAILVLNRASLSWQRVLTILFPAAILLVCMVSKINLGVRHILAIYPLLAILAGYAVAEALSLARRRSPVFALVPLALVAWVVADCRTVRPDFLAYFNGFAGAHPEKVLVEDLDFGQDLLRLSQRLRQRGVTDVSIKYFGGMPLELAGLPSFTSPSPTDPTRHGNLAVSAFYLNLEYARTGSFAWLRDRTPDETIGKSIYLYNLGP